MRSIRVFLVSIILALVMLFSFVAALRGYQSSMVAADKLFDKQLLDTAKLMGGIQSQQALAAVTVDNNFTFQVWRGQQLLAASTNAPDTAIQAREQGFNYNNFNGYRWRTVAYYQAEKNIWVMAAERSDLRFILAENVILQSIMPVVISLPVLALLIWLIVSKGLSPLRELAAELADKQPDDLSSLRFQGSRKELVQIVNSLNGLLGRLKTALLRERQFSSDAAHELRTPISTLKVQLYNIAELLPRHQQELVNINVTVERLAHIVDQILNLHRISPDQYNARMKRLNLDSLVQQVLADESERLDKKQQQLSYVGEAAHIRGDEFAIKTLLQNVLSNAHKYTPEHGFINVSVKRQASTIQLCIEDSGAGISEPMRTRVFERFYRVGGDSHSSGELGCGLGLAIVKNIAESHSARIELTDSSMASGTAFCVYFSDVDSQGEV
ncbi:ATP-binding protein [Dasania sp. GY-MA-18]|uniref:histidine kinase n=1 Tax=Dasania phycosphaerae TaxID=2950436 RepID=A0A9J6RM95_9GAMM|nr:MULTISPECIES: ATP-binding protein [Dasania]MCR8923010.1 ATP-binding protein [Dasania sp. GY-MA-18]MCZ0865441.1 ATP-binding protein [Dasania phycosphaerae]MCZ0869166.1 ATP-binding protein [Dasania phycosphaerae]